MKLTKFIKKLQEIKAIEGGDIEVLHHDYEGALISHFDFEFRVNPQVWSDNKFSILKGMTLIIV